MKTASDQRHPLSLMLGLLLAGFVAPAFAADNAPALQPLPMQDVIAVPVAPVNAPANNKKAVAALEDKVTDQAKAVVKQLSSVDNVNFDDLNTARQTVVKLEVLIDIEKHLAELDKLHNEHGEKTLAAAIPASALGVPLSMQAASKMPVQHIPAPVTSHFEVNRIAGADGHYSALIQGKYLHVGDTLQDGETVIAIAAKEVSIKAKDGSVKQLKVKGVDEVYGHTL